MSRIDDRIIYKLTEKERKAALKDFIDFLKIGKNEDAKNGLYYMYSALKQHKELRTLSAYIIQNRTPSVGFGKKPKYTIFSIKKDSQQLYFQLNGKRAGHKKEYEKACEIHGCKIPSKYSVDLNKLGNDKTHHSELKKLNKFMWFCCSHVEYIRKFLNVETDDEGQEAAEGKNQNTNSRDSAKHKRWANAVIKKYSGRCVITGCRIREALEVAHILSYSALTSENKFQFKVSNGIPMRKDFHGLMGDDNPLLILKPVKCPKIQIQLSKKLAGSEYADFDNKEIEVASDTFKTIKERYNRLKESKYLKKF